MMPILPVAPAIAALPLPVGLSADETRALVSFRERADLWPAARREEIADQAGLLSGASGAAGVSRLLAMADWVREKRPVAGGGGHARHVRKKEDGR